MARQRPSSDPTWEAPQDLFDKLNAEFHFTGDVCALPSNAKCSRYFTPDDDGLRQTWTGVCWCNPPYGRGKAIEQWVKKAHESAQAGATVVCLLPSSTDTQWWHRYVLPHAADIRWIEGRLRFGAARHNARFSSVVVIFTPEDLEAL